MSEINEIFIPQKLANGFVLLIFIDFEKCIEFFKQNTLMQNSLFFDIENIAEMVPDFPSKVAIIRPALEDRFDLWDAISKKSSISFGIVQNQPMRLLKSCDVVEGKEIAFMFSSVMAKELDLI